MALSRDSSLRLPAIRGPLALTEQGDPQSRLIQRKSFPIRTSATVFVRVRHRGVGIEELRQISVHQRTALFGEAHGLLAKINPTRPAFDQAFVLQDFLPAMAGRLGYVRRITEGS